MIDFVTILVSVLLGLVGGVAHVIMWAEKWADLKEFSAFKRIVAGGIVGLVYVFLHSDYGFPNAVMTFVAGFAGTDFIHAIIKKVQKKNGNGT